MEEHTETWTLQRINKKARIKAKWEASKLDMFLVDYMEALVEQGLIINKDTINLVNIKKDIQEVLNKY